jgi:hypothetical protein
MRVVLIVLGAIGGVLIRFVAHRVPSIERGGPSLSSTALAVVVNGAFGALAGLAVGALLDHFRGKRP